MALEVPPFRVVGTVYLYPGSEPDRLLDRSSEMFVPIVDAVARSATYEVTGPEVDVILVNRFYLRGVEQVDKRTGAPHPKLPGRPAGRHQLAGPLALTVAPRRRGRATVRAVVFDVGETLVDENRLWSRGPTGSGSRD